MVEYTYDFSFEKCFVCRHCRYELDKRLHYCEISKEEIDKRLHYCEISKEEIDNPHAGRCVNYQR